MAKTEFEHSVFIVSDSSIIFSCFSLLGARLLPLRGRSPTPHTPQTINLPPHSYHPHEEIGGNGQNVKNWIVLPSFPSLWGHCLPSSPFWGVLFPLTPIPLPPPFILFPLTPGIEGAFRLQERCHHV